MSSTITIITIIFEIRASKILTLSIMREIRIEYNQSPIRFNLKYLTRDTIRSLFRNYSPICNIVYY